MVRLSLSAYQLNIATISTLLISIYLTLQHHQKSNTAPNYMISGLNCTQGRVLQDGMLRSTVKHDTAVKSACVYPWMPCSVASFQTVILFFITTKYAIYIILGFMCS